MHQLKGVILGNEGHLMEVLIFCRFILLLEVDFILAVLSNAKLQSSMAAFYVVVVRKHCHQCVQNFVYTYFYLDLVNEICVLLKS
jgi:hypothetical protein